MDIKDNWNQIGIYLALLKAYDALMCGKKYTSLDSFKKATKAGILDLNKSLIDNVNNFISTLSGDILTYPRYRTLLAEYEFLLMQIKDRENLSKAQIKESDKALKDIMFSIRFVLYNEVEMTKIFMENPNMPVEDKLAFLHQQINIILAGGIDFSFVNSLDKCKFDPIILQQDECYNEFVKYLIDTYMVGFNKFDKDDFAEYIIRLIKRHLTKGYFVPDADMKLKIVDCYAYNLWQKDLRFMIENGKLIIGDVERNLVIETIKVALEKRLKSADITIGEYIDIFDKLSGIIGAMPMDIMKRVRKEEE